MLLTIVQGTRKLFIYKIALIWKEFDTQFKTKKCQTATTVFGVLIWPMQCGRSRVVLVYVTEVLRKTKNIRIKARTVQSNTFFLTEKPCTKFHFDIQIGLIFFEQFVRYCFEYQLFEQTFQFCCNGMCWGFSMATGMMLIGQH